MNVINLPSRSDPIGSNRRHISDLHNIHSGKPAFCLGTAPHLNELNLELLKDQVTLVCNQLVQFAGKYNFKYACFQNISRFEEFRESLEQFPQMECIITEQLANRCSGWLKDRNFAERIFEVRSRHTSPGHAEFFSLDLNNCVYAADVLALQIQLAVWMGCNPIYVLGVDASHQPGESFYFDSRKVEEVKAYEEYYFPDIKEWLSKARTLLWARGIKLLNAAGEHSSLSELPKTRLSCAVGRPKIAVTSKTFSQDPFLLKECRRHFQDLVINDSKDTLSGDKLVNFLKEADGAILGTEQLDAAVMEKLPCLRSVSKYGVGLDNIDFSAALHNQIEVLYQKGVNSDSVAELTLAFALMLIRRVDQSAQSFRSGKWSKLGGKELSEITLGIIGYGNIGKVVARKFAALGTGRLLIHDLLDFPVTRPFEFVSLDYLLSQSDVVTLHISADRNNHHFINRDLISTMKEGSVLINTARGDIVDTDALLWAIESGLLGGAALDVYEGEPVPDPRLIACEKIMTTCHMGGSSNRAIKNMGLSAIEGLARLFNLGTL